MEEGETASLLSRKELRKQKLMEYLAAKGRMKQPNPKPYLRDDCNSKKIVTSGQKFNGKENIPPPDTFKVNAKGSILSEKQNTKYPSATSSSVRPERGQKSAPTGLNTVSLKSNQNEASCLKKPPSRGIQTSAKASSVAASHSRLSRNSNTFRLSLGPVVKTKTGLMPAVTQPRITKSQVTNTCTTAADNSTKNTTTTASVNKVRPISSSSISVSRPSTVTQMKKPSTTLSKPVNKRTVYFTSLTEHKGRDQSNTTSKPVLGKPFLPLRKDQLSSCQKYAPTSKRHSEAQKTNWKGVISENKKPTTEPTRQKSQDAGEEKGKPCKVPTQTSTGLAGRASFKAVSGLTRTVMFEPRGKTKISIEAQCKKGHISTDAPQPRVGVNKTGTLGMSQRLPQPVRTMNHSGMKTPKVPVKVIPQTEVKKLTAAQEERMRKLQEWREVKGISYKRPPMPVKPRVRRTVAVPQPFWTAMKEEDDAHSLVHAVDRSLADCLKLLGEGCPPHQVKEVLSRLPTLAQKFAKYWICRVHLMELEGNLDVLPIFEEAVRVVLEPVDELRTVVFEILKKKDERIASEAYEREEDQIPRAESSPNRSNNLMMTPKAVRVLISGEKGESSVVKYKITATPGCPLSQQKEPTRVNGQEVRFFTPVRRSVRIERASLRYPVSLQDHDLCVASYSDLMSEEDKETCEEDNGGEISPSASDTPLYIYRQNEALKDKVQVQLVCD